MMIVQSGLVRPSLAFRDARMPAGREHTGSLCTTRAVCGSWARHAAQRAAVARHIVNVARFGLHISRIERAGSGRLTGAILSAIVPPRTRAARLDSIVIVRMST